MAAPRLPRVAPTAARIGQLRRRVKTKRFAKKAAVGAAVATGSFLLDFLEGFLDIEFKQGQKDKLGIFGKALGAGVSGGADDTLPLPAMETPERVSKENDPTIATISKQLDTLVKTANKIGVYTKEQQDALLNQLKQQKRVASEQQLEQKVPAIPELPEAGQTEANLEPLDTSVADLITRIDELSETLDGMSPSGGGMGAGDLLAALGLGSLFGLGRGKAPKVDIDESKLVDKNGKPLVGAARESKIAKLTRQATAAAAPTRSGIVRRAAAGIASTAASSKIANFMRAGASRGGAAVAASKSAIRGVAGPIIKKALGKTVLKSIPLIGAAAGVGFAIGRLLKGDVVGAGLDLASGLGGPLTAVPAFAASVTRDTYASVYGVQPEQDPNFNKNYPELKKTIEDIIREELGQSVQPKKTPTETEIGEVETPKVPPAAAPAKQPPAIPSPTAPAAATSQGATGNAPVTGDATGTPTTASTAVSTSGASSQAQQETPGVNTGETISQATMDTSSQGMADAMMTGQAPLNQDWMSSYGYDTSMGSFMPQVGAPQSRSGRQSIGNIPSPVYDNPDLIGFKKTLFFDF